MFLPRLQTAIRWMRAVSWSQRRAERVAFARGPIVNIMAIDGTWHRKCTMLDISSTGAKLRVEASIEGLELKEFFLLLSATGLAFRRCELVRLDGDEIAVNFLKERELQNHNSIGQHE